MGAWRTLPLSAAVMMGGFGEFTDGVIHTAVTDGGFPDFYFPAELLSAATAYEIEVTFDPTSVHDAGGREVDVFGVRPGHEVDDAFDREHGGSGPTYSGGDTIGPDVVAFTVGPGLLDWDSPTFGVAAGWSRAWFQTDIAGAVSQIRMRVVGPAVVPPLRQHPRSDGLGASSAPRLYPPTPSVQASNRRAGGYL